MGRAARRFDLAFALLASLLVLFVVLPLVAIVLAVTPDTFVQAFSDPEVVGAIVLTFTAAAIATLVAAFSGIPLAYVLARRRFRGRRLVEALVSLPLVVPHTAAGVALLLVFGRYGLLGDAVTVLGLTFVDTLGGIVVAMLFVSLPFLVIASQNAFAAVEPELEQVALADGASPWQAFWRVTLPLAWRGVLSGMLMMWARGMSEFGAVVILAYHPKVASVLVYERFEGFGLDAALPAVLLLLVSVLAVFVVVRVVLVPERGD